MPHRDREIQFRLALGFLCVSDDMTHVLNTPGLHHLHRKHLGFGGEQIPFLTQMQKQGRKATT